MTLRCLSVRNPWAWAICANAKSCENRTWSTEHRGLIAIHAGSSKEIVNHFKSKDRRFDPKMFEFGAVIGLVEVDDVVPYGPSVEENAWAAGPWCWLFSKGRFLKDPIPMKGKLNLFELTAEITEQVLSQSTELKESDEMYECIDIIKPPPMQPENYFEAAQHWLEKGDLEASNNAISQAVRLAPDWADAHYFQGWLACDRGEPMLAIESFTKTIELNPHLTDVYEQRGRLYLYADEIDNAWKDFQSAIATGSPTSAAYIGSAAILNQREEYDDAIKACDQALKLDPNEIFALMRRAEAFIGTGDHAASIADVSKALELAPNCFDALYIRGDAHRASGDEKAAESDHDEAEKIRLAATEEHS